MKKQKTAQKKNVFTHWTRKSYAIYNSLKKVVHIGALSVSCSLVSMQNQPLLAQSLREDSTTIMVKELNEIIISAEKPIPFQQMINIVAIINKEEIEKAAVENVQDLLKYIQGVDLRTRGNEGVQADVSLRGGTFDQIIILLNGINFTDPQTGHYSLNLPVPLKSVERIEILQGPFIWNSGASGFCGAINIITQNPSKTSTQLDFSYGGFNYFQANINSSLKLKKGFISLSGNHSQSDGFIDNTDFKIDNIYLSGSFPTKKYGNFDFQLGYQQKAYGANSFYSAKYKEQYDETKVLISSLKYGKQWNHWQGLVDIYYRKHHDRFELFRNEAPEWYAGHNYHLTDVAGGNLKAAYASPIGLTTLGFNLRNEHIYSSNLGEKMPKPKKDIFDDEGMFYYKKNRLYNSIFLQHELERKRYKTSIGIMTGGISNFGQRWYGAGSFTLFLQKNLDLKCWIQNIYRIPTFTDLYYKSATQIGNPNLHPEEGISTEISLQWHPEKWHINVTGFYRYGFWIIDWVKKNKEDDIWYSENMSNVSSKGINVFMEYAFDFSFLKKIRFNYDYLTANSSTTAYSSLYATDYLRNQFKILIDHSIWSSLSASWLFSFQDRAGRYFDYDQSKEVSYKPYFLCDLKILWNKPHYDLFFEVDNLFDTSYFDIGNIPQPGRWCKIGFSIKI